MLGIRIYIIRNILSDTFPLVLSMRELFLSNKENIQIDCSFKFLESYYPYV